MEASDFEGGQLNASSRAILLTADAGLARYHVFDIQFIRQGCMWMDRHLCT